MMIFEVGKCYQHTTGEKLNILGKLDTYYYGKCLIAETDKAEYKTVGEGEPYTENFHEITFEEFIEK